MNAAPVSEPSVAVAAVTAMASGMGRHEIERIIASADPVGVSFWLSLWLAQMLEGVEARGGPTIADVLAQLGAAAAWPGDDP